MIELICNPIAGNGFAARAVQIAIQKLERMRISYQLHYTEGKDHATDIARKIAKHGSEIIMAFGGDGTLSEIIQGIIGTQTALGIIPCGTGNDFAKTINIPINVEEAVDFALNHTPRSIDIGTLNQGYFLNVFGTGFDVLTLEYAERIKNHVRGIWPYLYGVLCSILFYRPAVVKINIDNLCFEGKYMILCIGNGKYIGGGMPILPLAKPDDGLLEVLLLEDVPCWKKFFYLPSLLKGTLYQKKISHRFQAKRVLIQKEGMHVEVDGEIRHMDKAELGVSSDQLLLCW